MTDTENRRIQCAENAMSRGSLLFWGFYVRAKKLRMIDPRARPMPQPWSSIVDDYLNYCKALGLAPESINTFRSRLAHLARRAEKPPHEYSQADLLAYLGEQKWMSSTRRARLQTIRGFSRWAFKNGRLPADLTEGVPLGRASVPNPKAVPYVTYIESLMRSDQRTRIILRLAGENGLRRGEIAKAHSGDLVRTSAGWSLSILGKGSKPRVVPLTSDLANSLLDLPTGYFFPGKIDGHLSPRRVSELAQMSLPPPWTIHKLRHMFATRSFNVSKDLVSVQEMLGHASIQTTRIYVEADLRAQREIVESVAVRSFDAARDAEIRELESRFVSIDLENVTSAQAAKLIAVLSRRLRTTA